MLPVDLRGLGSLSVKEPVSSLPQIYGDASAKLSHMAFQLAACAEVRERQREREGDYVKVS